VRDIEVELRRPARLPVVLKPAVELTAPQGDDRVGSANGPEHPRLFETFADHGFAASLNHAGADEEMLSTEFWVTHAQGVAVEVIGLDANLPADSGLSVEMDRSANVSFFILP